MLVFDWLPADREISTSSSSRLRPRAHGALLLSPLPRSSGGGGAGAADGGGGASSGAGRVPTSTLGASEGLSMGAADIGVVKAGIELRVNTVAPAERRCFTEVACPPFTHHHSEDSAQSAQHRSHLNLPATSAHLTDVAERASVNLTRRILHGVMSEWFQRFKDRGITGFSFSQDIPEPDTAARLRRAADDTAGVPRCSHFSAGLSAVSMGLLRSCDPRLLSTRRPHRAISQSASTRGASSVRRRGGRRVCRCEA